MSLWFVLTQNSFAGVQLRHLCSPLGLILNCLHATSSWVKQVVLLYANTNAGSSISPLLPDGPPCLPGLWKAEGEEKCICGIFFLFFFSP